MADHFRLLNGETRDLSHQLDGRSFIEHDRGIVLRADFATPALPDWLTYASDNGPTEPTINDVLNGGMSDATIETGGTATTDTATLSGPTINWNDWTEIRCYVWGAIADAGWPDQETKLTFADARYPEDRSEAIGFALGDGGAFAEVMSGGSDDSVTSDQTIDFTSQPHSAGFRIYENDDSGGHSIDWVTNGQYIDSYAEAQGGWPAAQNLTLHLATYCPQNPAVRGFTLDGLLVELIR